VTIVLAMLSLDYAGVPTFVVTLSDELRRRGHDVTVFCPRVGRAGRPLEGRLPVATNLSDLPVPDVMIAHHTTSAVALRSRFLEVPMVFLAHGVVSPESQPPPVRVDAFVAINEQTVDHLFARRIPLEQIAIVRDFVNVARFAPSSPLRDVPRVLFVSNYKKWKNHSALVRACAKLGFEFRAVGAPYGRSKHIERDMNNADVVVSWGRGILEAMACGRAVVSFDQTMGDGYLDETRYYASRRHNFGPLGCLFDFGEDWHGLASELERYRPADGERNRRLAVTYHHHETGADQLLAVLQRVA
jgi:O-antigen biosynthesis protein